MSGGPGRPTTCIAPGCDERLPASTGRGRPRLYCSPRCRQAGGRVADALVVEVDHEPHDDAALRPVGRVWLVRVRRGQREVVVASELGRPSADHLAGQLAAVIAPRQRTAGGAID
jgi:hypothetical protein